MKTFGTHKDAFTFLNGEKKKIKKQQLRHLTGFELATIIYVQGVSEKKYGVADFINILTQCCNIFRHNKYIFYLVVC